MALTANLAMTLVETAQAQKEVTVNAALQRMDALLNTGVIDKDLATPPGSPVEGDLYIVAASPTGAWAGQAGKLAWFSQLWRFITPKEGATLWVKDEDALYSYNGAKWAPALLGQVRQTVTAAATTTLDLSAGAVVELAQAVSITNLVFSNPSPSGTGCSFTLLRVKDNSATARTISWPASVKWAGGVAPTLTQTANAVDIFQFLSLDGGTKWYGQALGLNFS